MKSGETFLCLKSFVIVVYLVFNVNGQQSPCPQVFEYKFDGHTWHGSITLPSVGRGRTNLAVTLSIEDNLTQDNAGQLQLLNDLNTLIQTIDSGGLLNYKVVFPISDQIPNVQSVKLNKREYCGNIGVPSTGIESTITIIHSFQTETQNQQSGQQFVPQLQQQPQPIAQPIPQPISVPVPQVVSQPDSFTPPVESHFKPSNNNDPSWLASISASETCGIKRELDVNTLMPVHTIINGKPVDPGEYPWLVALYQQPMTYICGGSLVSNKHIITAAHCINVPWLYAELGRYNREDKSEDVIFRISREIVIHPDYKPQTGHADIAVVILTEEVKYSNKIMPICLWPFGKRIVRMTGIIAGWGKDQSGDSTPKPMQTDVDIVTDEECLQAHDKFAEITSENTFCAGGKGKGPCLGDSGSGMFIRQNNRWYLRGVISISLGNKYTCDVNKYAVYADVATYLDWLRSYIL